MIKLNRMFVTHKMLGTPLSNSGITLRDYRALLKHMFSFDSRPMNDDWKQLTTGQVDSRE